MDERGEHLKIFKMLPAYQEFEIAIKARDLKSQSASEVAADIASKSV